MVSSPITVCYLEHGTSGGGSFESLLQLIAHLDRSVVSSIVVFVNVTPYIERLRAMGVPVMLLDDPVYTVSVRGAWRRAVIRRTRAAAYRIAPSVAVRGERIAHARTIRALTRLLRTGRVDILHCNNQLLRDAYAITAAQRVGVPVVSALRSVRIGAGNRALIAWAAARVVRCIANAEYTASFWTAAGIPADRITVIPNAIADTHEMPVAVRGAFPIPIDATAVIACVGNLTVGKGHRFLLEGFAQLLVRAPRTALLLVGDGPLRRETERYAEALGVRDRIVFTGYDTRAAAIIAGCDALVLPSETETFGRVLLEAMRARVPIVATRVGGIPDVVTDGVHALLVPYGDAEALAAAMDRILGDRSLVARLTAAGYDRCATEYRMDRHVARTVALYRDVLGIPNL